MPRWRREPGDRGGRRKRRLPRLPPYEPGSAFACGAHALATASHIEKISAKCRAQMGEWLGEMKKRHGQDFTETRRFLDSAKGNIVTFKVSPAGATVTFKSLD